MISFVHRWRVKRKRSVKMMTVNEAVEGDDVSTGTSDAVLPVVSCYCTLPWPPSPTPAHTSFNVPVVILCPSLTHLRWRLVTSSTAVAAFTLGHCHAYCRHARCGSCHAAVIYRWRRPTHVLTARALPLYGIG